MSVELIFLGTGTSQGVPIIGCNCPKCKSADPRDKRLRSSALVKMDGLTILVDAGPDFRAQMLREGVSHLDAILLTHNHKDHTGGLDDVRSLNYTDRKAAEIYCEEKVLGTLRNDYAYAFAEHKYPGAPEWHVHLIDDRPFRVDPITDAGELEWVHDIGYFYRQADGTLLPSSNEVARAPLENANVIPIRGYHDTMPVLGFRFGDIAYITDMSKLPSKELEKLHGLKHLTLNTVGYKPHHSHFSLDEALELADTIGAEHTWLTHLSHTFPCHEQFCEELRGMCQERGIGSDVQPAYDGLILHSPNTRFPESIESQS
ncbi:MAG: MBL fold metallo-hydrolase [Bacteroidales bacterium]|nr:MBL fold metallo-hydrolase [Bacteroidales bacterium]